MIELTNKRERIFYIGEGEIWGSVCEWRAHYWLQPSKDGKEWIVWMRGEGERSRSEIDFLSAAEIRNYVENELPLCSTLTDKDWQLMGLA